MERNLSLESEFQIIQFQSKLEDLSEEDIKILLVDIYRHMLIKELYYKNMLMESLHNGL
jgi:hypothetical protein